jgi:predicted phage terminase large subunit-like protein
LKRLILPIICSIRARAAALVEYYPALKASVQTLAKKWNARRVLVEDAGAGTSLVQELRGRATGIVAIKPDGDKASCMAVASAKFEAGQALLPEWALWLPGLEAELFAFPGSRHDDQCDSVSQAPLDKNNSFMTWLSLEDWEVLLAKARTPVRKPIRGLCHMWTSDNRGRRVIRR